MTCNTIFYVLLKVYLNGILKHESNTYVANSGPTYNFVKVVNMSVWGHQEGDALLYRGRAYIPRTPYYDEEDWNVTVPEPITRLVPAHSWRLVADRDREEWA